MPGQEVELISYTGGNYQGNYQKLLVAGSYQPLEGAYAHTL